MNPQKTTAPPPPALRPLRRIPTMLLSVLLTGLLTGCGTADDGDSAQPTATVFDGAKVTVGNTSGAIQDAAIVVDNGWITQVGPRSEV